MLLCQRRVAEHWRADAATVAAAAAAAIKKDIMTELDIHSNVSFNIKKEQPSLGRIIGLQGRSPHRGQPGTRPPMWTRIDPDVRGKNWRPFACLLASGCSGSAFAVEPNTRAPPLSASPERWMSPLTAARRGALLFPPPRGVFIQRLWNQV